MKCQSQLIIDEGRVVGQHIARQSLADITGSGEEVGLATGFAHQHVGTGHTGAAGQVEANERNLASTLHGNTTALFQRFQIRRQRGGRHARVAKQAEHRGPDDGGGAGPETLGNELPAGTWAAVIAVSQRLMDVQGALA